MLEISNLNYLDFKDFNLKIEENSYTSIVGSNKSGKTTVFKIMSGLIEILILKKKIHYKHKKQHIILL